MVATCIATQEEAQSTARQLAKELRIWEIEHKMALEKKVWDAKHFEPMTWNRPEQCWEGQTTVTKKGAAAVKWIGPQPFMKKKETW